LDHGQEDPQAEAAHHHPPPGRRGTGAAGGDRRRPASRRDGGAGGGDAPSAAPVAAATTQTLGSDAARRRVGRIGPAAPPSALGGRQQRQAVRSARFGSAAAMVESLDSDDPAIPFDRVPYVPSDLRRVATIAALMVVLILIAWAIVSRVVD
jgi:hypothetical protein